MVSKARAAGHTPLTLQLERWTRLPPGAAQQGAFRVGGSDSGSGGGSCGGAGGSSRAGGGGGAAGGGRVLSGDDPTAAAAAAAEACAAAAASTADAAAPLGLLIGRGMFSEVFAGAVGLAVKVARPLDAGGRTAADTRRAKALLREIRISRSCDHPNVVRLLGAAARGSGFALTYARADTDLQRLVNSPLRRRDTLHTLRALYTLRTLRTSCSSYALQLASTKARLLRGDSSAAGGGGAADGGSALPAQRGARHSSRP